MSEFLTPYQVAQMIDHAILRPETTLQMLKDELQLADKLNVFSVCVRPVDVVNATAFLKDLNSKVKVGTVIGFPHGSQSHKAKVFEIVEAVREGAVEVDVVVNVGFLKDANQFEDACIRFSDELKDLVVQAKTAGVKVTKLILETALLTDEEILLGSRLGSDAGFDYIKTSTGFAGEGATEKNLLLMKQAAGLKAQLKASGGVSDFDTLKQFHDLGVTRFGTSKAATILSQVDGWVAPVDVSADRLVDTNPEAY